MSRYGKKHEIINRILLAFPRADFERIEPHLEWIDLTPRNVIHQAGRRVEYLYFVNRGVVSLVKTMQDGRTAEIGAVGTEGLVGLFALHGVERTIWESVVQEPGTALRIKCTVVQAEIMRSESFRRLVQRYTYYVISDLAQTAACNRLHSLEERCSRLLLIAHDSARSNTFPLTHEFLALMLGVQRSGLSITANILQKAGLIHYKRGHVTITDRPGLEAVACECYGTMRTQLDRLFNPKKPA